MALRHLRALCVSAFAHGCLRTTDIQGDVQPPADKSLRGPRKPPEPSGLPPALAAAAPPLPPQAEASAAATLLQPKAEAAAAPPSPPQAEAAATRPLPVVATAVKAETGAKAKKPPPQPIIFPQQFVDTVASFRKVCKWYGTFKGCQKGDKCASLHATQGGAKTAWAVIAEADNKRRMPHTSLFVDEAGNTQLTVRPLLREAAKAWFAAHKRPMTLDSPSRQFEVEGLDFVFYTLSHMPDPDRSSIGAAQQTDCCKPALGNHGRVTKRDMPACLGHVTSVAKGVSIIKDGHIASEDGVAGRGANGFEMADSTMESVTDEFSRTAVGGCLVVAELDGILINKMAKQTEEVPAGCVAYKGTASGDQFCANPGTLSFCCIVFDVRALLDELGTL